MALKEVSLLVKGSGIKHGYQATYRHQIASWATPFVKQLSYHVTGDCLPDSSHGSSTPASGGKHARDISGG